MYNCTFGLTPTEARVMLKPSADAEEVAKKIAEGQVVLAKRINLARGVWVP
jgi:hypothetical protein